MGHVAPGTCLEYFSGSPTTHFSIGLVHEFYFFNSKVFYHNPKGTTKILKGWQPHPGIFLTVLMPRVDNIWPNQMELVEMDPLWSTKKAESLWNLLPPWNPLLQKWDAVLAARICLRCLVKIWKIESQSVFHSKKRRLIETNRLFRTSPFHLSMMWHPIISSIDMFLVSC